MRLPDRSAQAAFGVLAQLTQGVIGLALLLVGHQTHLSVTTSALSVSAYAVGMAIGRPVQGRALDTVAPRAVLAFCGSMHAGGYVLIAVAAHQHWALAYVVFGFLTGLALPPIATQMRAEWPQERPAGQATSIFALIALLQTLSVLLAPVLFSIVNAASTPTSAMLSVAGVSGAFTVVFALAIPRARSRRTDQQRVAVRRYFVLLALTGLLAVVIGSVEVIAPAIAIADGHPSVAGPLVIVATVGMVAAGTAAMRWGARVPTGTMLASALASEVVGSVVLLVPAPLVISGIGLVLVAAGDTPAIAALGSLVRERSAGTAEAYGWQSTAVGLGVAGGSAIAGGLVPTGAHWSALPALVAALACAALARRFWRPSAGYGG